jgi:putative glutamine amidotransferase
MNQKARDPAPLIGITGPRLLGAEITTTPPILLGAWVDSYYAHYSAAVATAGGTPVHLSRHSDPWGLVHRLDGLLVAGGQDVDPHIYGKQPAANTSRLDPVRDRFEADLIRAAIEYEVPLLGICRGAQLLNVTLGGSLVQDLLADQEIEHARWIYPPELRTHEIACLAGSLVHEIYGERTCVNSFHHQAIAELGDGIEVTARAPDGMVEAIEIDGLEAIGVQWHPELLSEPDAIFEWLVSRSADKQAGSPRLERSVR